MKTPAQVILRWDIQSGIVTIPKSVTPSRIQENFSIFDFSLTEEEMTQINTLNRNLHVGTNPDKYDTLKRRYQYGSVFYRCNAYVSHFTIC